MAVQRQPSQKEGQALKLAPAYDIVILGGGPAGLAAAIALLKRLSVSVLIVEARTAEQERIGESCPPDTLIRLSQLQLSSEFRRGGHATCPGYASVWGSAQVGYNDFIVNPMGPSWRLDRRAFDEMLARKACAAGATLARPFRFIKARKASDHSKAGYDLTIAEASTKDHQQIRARFVVDATGNKARFATALGIKQQVEDQLYALVRFANVKAGNITQQVLLEATPEGWWYTALLPQGRIVSMAVTEKDTLGSWQKDDYQGFKSALHQTTFIGKALGQLRLANENYYTWPIRSSILSQIEGKDWLAIGDAASSYDPIAAQGIHKALTNGINAVEKIASFFQQGDYQEGTFTKQIRESFAVYQQNRAYSYRLEQRWPTAPFWRNRHRL